MLMHCQSAVVYCCPVPWVATNSSRAREARRDWLQQLRLMNYDAPRVVQVL